MITLLLAAFSWLLIIWAAFGLAICALIVYGMVQGWLHAYRLRADLDRTLDRILGQEREASMTLYSTTRRDVMGVPTEKGTMSITPIRKARSSRPASSSGGQGGVDGQRVRPRQQLHARDGHGAQVHVGAHFDAEQWAEFRRSLIAGGQS